MPRQSIVVDVGNNRNATLDYWRIGGNANSQTLLLWSHGMQDPAFLEPAHPVILQKNFAFTVPFDNALNNMSFTGTEHGRFGIYASTFVDHAARFRSDPPRLYIYPFLNIDQTIRAALNHVDGQNVCDLMYLTDLDPDYIRLQELLLAQHPDGVPFYVRYNSFFLIACRSNSNRGIGLGGAPPTYADGLYKGDDSLIIRWE